MVGVTNLTNLTAIDSMYDWGLYASKSTEGLFWGIILIVLFIVIIAKLGYTQIEKSAAASGFVCFILALIFLSMNYIQIIFPVIFAVIVAGSLAVLMFRARTGE